MAREGEKVKAIITCRGSGGEISKLGGDELRRGMRKMGCKGTQTGGGRPLPPKQKRVQGKSLEHRGYRVNQIRTDHPNFKKGGIGLTAVAGIPPLKSTKSRSPPDGPLTPPAEFRERKYAEGEKKNVRALQNGRTFSKGG